MRDYLETTAGNEHRVRFVWLLRFLQKLIPSASRRERFLRWSLDKYRRYVRLIRKNVLGESDRRFNKWLHENQPNLDLLARQSSEFASLRHKSHFSIIILSSSHSIEHAQHTVNSLKAQTIPSWDITMLVDSDDSVMGLEEHHLSIVEDERHQLRTFSPEIDSLVDILKELTGDFIIWLSEGDRLAPDALWEIVSAIQQNPIADLLYTDEDTFDMQKNRRMQPWLKPDWSPELLLSINYLIPLIVRKSILAEVLTEGWQLSKDKDRWDLALRCVEKARAIIHVPKILYHSRTPSPLTRSSATTKSKAVLSYFERIGIKDARVREHPHSGWRAIWSTRGELVSIIIPTKDHPNILRRCLEGILHQTSYPNLQVIIVDTGSLKDETLDYYDQIKVDDRVRLVSCHGEFNYQTANNIGAQQADGVHLLFLNDDIEVIDTDWLEEMVRWSERDEIGAVGAKLLFPDWTIQHAGIIIGLGGYAGHVFRGEEEGEVGPFGSVEWYRNYLSVTGACLMIPRSVFAQISGFNEDYRLVFGDVELCLKIVEQGYRVLYTPFARLIHHEGVSRGWNIPIEDLLQAYNALIPLLSEGDPYFNRNLTYSKSIPNLRLKPEDRIKTLEKIIARRLAVEGEI